MSICKNRYALALRRVTDARHLAALVGCIALFAAATANAQIIPGANAPAVTDPDRVAVLDRPRPEWEALGVPAGGFMLFPKLTIDAEYDSNILATRTDPLADEFFSFQPQITAQSNWGQNALSLVANATADRYADHPSQNSDQYSVTTDGILNASRDLTLSGEASYARVLIPRTSVVVGFSTTPLLYDLATSKVSVEQTLNRIKIQSGLEFENYAYLDGLGANNTPISYRFRDNDQYKNETRVEYDFSPETALFAEETLSYGHSVRPTYSYSFTNDTLIGIDFIPTHLVSAEFAAGYLSRSYSTPGSSVGDPDYRAKLIYYPARTLTLKLTAEQALVDSGLPTSPAYTSRTLEVEADYELLRDVIITGAVNTAWNSYEVIDRHDTDIGAKLSVTYLVNRDIGVMFSVEHSERSSQTTQPTSGNLVDAGFGKDIVSLSLVLQR